MANKIIKVDVLGDAQDTDLEDMAAEGLPELPIDQPYEGSTLVDMDGGRYLLFKEYMGSKTMRTANIVISAIALIAWIVMVLFSLLFGGSPGPGYERIVPLAYVGIMMLGIAGAALSLVGAFLWTKAAKPLPVAAAALGILGSFPFFSMGLAGVGLAFLILGILPPIICFTFARRRER